MKVKESERWIPISLLLGAGMCTIIAVVGSIAFDQNICLNQPLPNQAPYDYPNPRCPSLIQNGGRFDHDKGAMWYFWKLPRANELPEAIGNESLPFDKEELWLYSPIGQVICWILYCAHQLSIWYMQYTAQTEFAVHGKFVSPGNEGPKFSKTMRRFNYISFVVNLFFWLMHFIHTMVWYDALAQTVHESSSQGSVILMLILIAILETPRRGTILGLGKKVIRKDAVDCVKRTHGYLFSWAVIYTFWYHPMEPYFGHLLGFMHVWIVMAQGSLMYTEAHRNKYWKFLCETWVLLHGGGIAMQSAMRWQMFLFGFGVTTCFTHIPGLILDKHILIRAIPGCILVAMALITYFTIQKFRIYAIISIPFVLIVVPPFFGLGIRLVHKIFKTNSSSASVANGAEKNNENISPEQLNVHLNKTKRWFAVFMVVIFSVNLVALVAEEFIDRDYFVANTEPCLTVPVQYQNMTKGLDDKSYETIGQCSGSGKIGSVVLAAIGLGVFISTLVLGEAFPKVQYKNTVDVIAI